MIAKPGQLIAAFSKFMLASAVLLGGPFSFASQVTTLVDEDDGNALESNGAGASLRELVQYSSSGTVITFAAGFSGDTITLAGGEIVVENDISIDASELEDGITISGNGASRLFTVLGGASLYLEFLNLDSGYDAGTDGGGAVLNYGTVTIQSVNLFRNEAEFGGAIASQGILEIYDSALFENTAVFGAAIYNDPGGSASLTRTSLYDNTATEEGGGIFNEAQLTLDSCDITGNKATSYGGAIVNFADGSLEIYDSYIASNDAPRAGAIDNFDTVIVDGSEFFSNTAVYGGAMFNEAGIESSMEISNTLFGSNFAAANGGGFYNDFNAALVLNACELFGNESTYGGAIDNYSLLDINNSTLANNIADQGGAIISEDGSDIILNNATLSGNYAITSGGAVQNQSGTVIEINNSTIVGNWAQNGGGVLNAENGELHLFQSILGNNEGGDLLGVVAQSSGVNLVEDASQSEGLRASDISGLDPLLAPLGDYGGPTLTMSPLPGSPVIDAGSASAIFDTDQRGIARDGSADLGAVEILKRSGFVDTDNDLVDDRIEAFFGYHVGTKDGILDTDGDGSSNAAEIRNFTAPYDATSSLQIVSFDLLGKEASSGDRVFELKWTAIPGLGYEIAREADLTLGEGSAEIEQVVVSGNSGSREMTVPAAENQLFVHVRAAVE